MNDRWFAPAKRTNAREHGWRNAGPWVVLGGADVLYRVVMAGYWVLLTRLLVRHDVGLVALANAVAVAAVILCDAGFSQYLVREYRLGTAGGLAPELSGPLRRRQLLMLVVPLVIGALCVVLGRGMRSGVVGLLIGASYSFDLIGQMWLVGARAHARMEPDAKIKALQSLGVLMALVVLHPLVGIRVVHVALVSALVYAMASLVALREWRRYPQWIAADPAAAGPGRRRLSFSSGQGAFAATAVLIALYTRLDSVMVQVLFGSSALATYAVAFRLIEAGRVGPWAIARVVLASAKTDTSEDKRGVILSQVRSSIILGASVAAAIACAGPKLLQLLFGESYAVEGDTVVRVLAVTVALVGVTSPLVNVLFAGGDDGFVVRTALTTLVVSVVGVALFSRWWGLVGTAVAVAVGELTSACLYVVRLRHRGLLPKRPDIVVLGALAALTAATLLLIPPLSAGTLASGALAGMVGLGSAIGINVRPRARAALVAA